MTDEELIARAVAEGKVRKFPNGETSNWDQIPFRQRRSFVLNSMKKAKEISSNVSNAKRPTRP